MELSISNFHTSFYIPSIQNLSFNLPPVFIIESHHCDKKLYEEFNHCGYFQSVLCCCEYEERVVDSFVHQI